MAAYPWIPSGGYHAKAPAKWRYGCESFNRFTGIHDLSIGQYVMCRMRFVSAGDLSGASDDFGGPVSQLNLIAIFTDMAIADRAGVAITYSRRIHRNSQKLSQKSSRAAAYFDILINDRPDIEDGAPCEFEYNTGLRKKANGGSGSNEGPRKSGYRTGRKTRPAIQKVDRGRPGRLEEEDVALEGEGEEVGLLRETTKLKTHG